MQPETIYKTIKEILKQRQELSLCMLYGSFAGGSEHFESDIDLAVAGKEPLTSKKLMAITETLAVKLKRPIDLVDLQQTTGTLLHQILTKGRLIYCTDRILYAKLIKKMLYNQADMMPYHYRILKERRERWING